MADVQVQPLPPGWDCRFDKKSGRYYFINHTTKLTTWDDPRAKIEYIPLQHGSPELRRNYVYPSQTTPIHAFQVPAAAHYTPKITPIQDFNHLKSGGSPKLAVQDSSLKAVVNTDEAVAKIGATFPTVSDTHIRLLLKKYMKSIFPKAEEMLILDLLSGNDNNVQKVSDALKEMGFERRDSVPKVKPAVVVEPPKVEDIVTVVLKTLDEKKQLVAQLHEKYADIPEQVVTLALESVEYDEPRAHQILNIMLQEESGKAEENGVTQCVTKSQSRQSLKSILKTDKSDYSLKDVNTFSRVIEAEDDVNAMGENVYRSSNITNTQGANRNNVKGANHNLLLEDYVKWHGPQPSHRQGPKSSLAKGPNPALLGSRSYQACGPNAALRKGPQLGLAKGSVYSQMEVRSK